MESRNLLDVAGNLLWVSSAFLKVIRSEYSYLTMECDSTYKCATCIKAFLSVRDESTPVCDLWSVSTLELLKENVSSENEVFC
jgi:hypothetical protein